MCLFCHKFALEIYLVHQRSTLLWLDEIVNWWTVVSGLAIGSTSLTYKLVT